MSSSLTNSNSGGVYSALPVAPSSLPNNATPQKSIAAPIIGATPKRQINPAATPFYPASSKQKISTTPSITIPPTPKDESKIIAKSQPSNVNTIDKGGDKSINGQELVERYLTPAARRGTNAKPEVVSTPAQGNGNQSVQKEYSSKGTPFPSANGHSANGHGNSHPQPPTPMSVQPPSPYILKTSAVVSKPKSSSSSSAAKTTSATQFPHTTISRKGTHIFQYEQVLSFLSSMQKFMDGILKEVRRQVRADVQKYVDDRNLEHDEGLSEKLIARERRIAFAKIGRWNAETKNITAKEALRADPSLKLNYELTCGWYIYTMAQDENKEINPSIAPFHVFLHEFLNQTAQDEPIISGEYEKWSSSKKNSNLQVILRHVLNECVKLDGGFEMLNKSSSFEAAVAIAQTPRPNTNSDQTPRAVVTKFTSTTASNRPVVDKRPSDHRPSDHHAWRSSSDEEKDHDRDDDKSPKDRERERTRERDDRDDRKERDNGRRDDRHDDRRDRDGDRDHDKSDKSRRRDDRDDNDRHRDRDGKSDRDDKRDRDDRDDRHDDRGRSDKDDVRASRKKQHDGNANVENPSANVSANVFAGPSNVPMIAPTPKAKESTSSFVAPSFVASSFVAPKPKSMAPVGMSRSMTSMPMSSRPQPSNVTNRYVPQPLANGVGNGSTSQTQTAPDLYDPNPLAIQQNAATKQITFDGAAPAAQAKN